MQVNRGHPKRDAQIASESGASPVLISVGIQFESLGIPRADLCREKLICFGFQLISVGLSAWPGILRTQMLMRYSPQIFIGRTNS